jgi:L-threonylcarbamoyladenylate synthase
MSFKTTVIQCDNPLALQTAITYLDRDEIISFPTDTVYGIASRVTSSNGIDRLFQAKGRDFSKSIAVLIGNLDQLFMVASEITPTAKKLIDRFWPGALTVVVPKKPGLPLNLSQNNTIGVRMPSHKFVIKLLQWAGPLATTSANKSGDPNPLNAQDVLDALDGQIGLLLDGGNTTGSVASTVVDCTKKTPVILREGIISALDIKQAVGPTL